MKALLRRIITRLCGPMLQEVKYVPVYVPVLESNLLKGRKALVTGATSGIGLAMAEYFLKAGASVIVSGRNEQKLAAVVEQLRQFGDVSSCLMDMTRPDDFKSAIGALGEFDILVNNAGYVGGGSFGKTEVSEYDKVLETNLRGAYFLSQAVSVKWIASGTKGNILNVCSASSLRPGESPYILSKWGLRSLTIGMARSLIKHGIVVNGIAPGCTNTEQFCPADRNDINNDHSPSGRLVTMQEVANLAVVMASGLARMVVGDILYVTGGGAVTTFDD